MDCVMAPGWMVGPTAETYEFPIVSLSDATVAEVSLEPTTTTFRLPAVCAPLNGTATVIMGVCGVAEFTCTNAGPVCSSRAPDSVARSPDGLQLAPAARRRKRTK